MMGNWKHFILCAAVVGAFVMCAKSGGESGQGGGGAAGGDGGAGYSPVGDLDSTFDSSSGANNYVAAIAIDANGKILIGGNFTSYAGTTRQRIARLNADGSLDTSFDSSSGANDYVTALALDSNGKILIVGNFTSYAGTTRQRIARLNADGTLDTGFDSSTGANIEVATLAIDSNGKIVIGGSFNTYGGSPRTYLARVNTDGTLDTSFTSQASSSIDCLAIDASNRVLIGGGFASYALTQRQRIARLNTDGTLDTTFNAFNGADNFVSRILIDNNGKILIGGAFTTYASTTRQRVARLNSDGSLDTSFSSVSGANGIVNALALDNNGKILIGGWFTTYSGIARQRIARINSDGSLDTAFVSTSGANDYLSSVGIDSNRKILIGGNLTSYGGTTRQYVARLK